MEKGQHKPDLLKVLCILSFVGGGLSVLTNGLMYLFIDLWVQAYADGQFDDLLSSFNMDSMQLFFSVDKRFFLFQTILYVVSIAGVYYMWKLKKAGFHMYTVSQILVIIVQQIYFPELPFPVLPLLLTLTFVLLYFTNLKYME